MAKLTKEEILKTCNTILCEIINKDAALFTSSSSLNEINLDILDRLELIMLLEDSCKIVIDDDQFNTRSTLGQLVDYIYQIQ